MSASVAVMEKTDDKLLASLEQAKAAAQQQVQTKQQDLDRALGRVESIQRQINELRVELKLGDAGEDYAPSTGSVTSGIREMLQQLGKSADAFERTVTAKDVETWLIRKGYRTGAKNFYWTVYGTLRGMQEVVGLVKERETTRFAWRESLPKAPSGWRLVDFKRRTTLASRHTPETLAAKAKAAKGKGAK